MTTQIVTKLENSKGDKLKNSNCDKTQIVTKLENLNYDKTQSLDFEKTQKIKNCDKT